MNFNLKRDFLKIALVGVLAIPVAIVVACGESSSTETPAPSPAQQEATTLINRISALKPEAGSTHTNIIWPADAPSAVPASLSNYYEKLEYSASQFASAEQALASTASSWQTKIITAVHLAKPRQLWARLVAKQGASNVTSIATQINGVNDALIKANVDQLLTESNFKLSDISLSVTNNVATIEDAFSSPLLEQYLTLEYRLDSAATWQPKTTFLSTLNSTSNPNYQNVEVQAVVKNATEAVLAKPLQGKPTVATELTTEQAQTQGASLINAISNLSPEAGSTHNNISWPNTAQTTLPNRLAPYFTKLEYREFNYASVVAALGDTTNAWQTSIVTKVALAKPRYVWVRLVAKGANTSIAALINGVNHANVKVDVDELLLASNFKVSDVQLNVLNAVASISDTLPDSLTPYIKLEYRYNNGEWLAKAAFLDALNKTANPNYQNVEVHTVLTTPSESSLLSPLQGKPTVKVETTTEQPVAVDAARQREAEAYMLSLQNLPISASIHTKLVWNNVPDMPSSISNYFYIPQYSFGTWDSSDQALADKTNAWQNSIPQSAPLAKPRKLFVRLLTRPGFSGISPIATRILNSESALILDDVDQIIKDSGFKLSDVKLNVTYERAKTHTLDESFDQTSMLGKYIKLEYRTGTDATWVDKVALLAALPPTTYFDFANIQVRTALLDARTSALSAPLVGAPTITELGPSASLVAELQQEAKTYLDAVAQLIPETGSTNASIIWPKVTPISDTLSLYFAPASFILESGWVDVTREPITDRSNLWTAAPATDLQVSNKNIARMWTRLLARNDKFGFKTVAARLVNTNHDNVLWDLDQLIDEYLQAGFFDLAKMKMIIVGSVDYQSPSKDKSVISAITYGDNLPDSFTPQQREVRLGQINYLLGLVALEYSYGYAKKWYTAEELINIFSKGDQATGSHRRTFLVRFKNLEPTKYSLKNTRQRSLPSVVNP